MTTAATVERRALVLSFSAVLILNLISAAFLRLFGAF